MKDIDSVIDVLISNKYMKITSVTGTKPISIRRNKPLDNEMNTSVPSVDRIQEISKSLDQITEELRDLNDRLKIMEKQKEGLRSRFFSMANEYLRLTKAQDTQVVSVKLASRAEAEKYVEDHYPGWSIIQWDTDRIVIEENPEQMRFEWTTEDGYHIGRSTAIVGTKFDYEMLQDLRPDLFGQIVDVKTVYELNEKKAQKLIESHPEYLDVLQQSTRLGKVQLRMSSPKKVEDE